MGRNVGIEPTHNGTTIHRVNHFTNSAINNLLIEFTIKNTKIQVFFINFGHYPIHLYPKYII